MAKQITDAAWYADTLKAWPKAAGPKPTAEHFRVAHYFGKPGKQSLALAMAMRDTGTTAPQIEAVCERPQNTHRKRAIKLGYFDRVATPADGSHTVYKITLTEKGKQKVGGAVSMAKPEKAPKAPAKAPRKRPAKVKAPEAPTAAPEAVVPQAPEAQAGQ